MNDRYQQEAKEKWGGAALYIREAIETFCGA